MLKGHSAVITMLPHGAEQEGASFDLATAGEVALVRELGIGPERCIHTQGGKIISAHKLACDRRLRSVVDVHIEPQRMVGQQTGEDLILIAKLFIGSISECRDGFAG